MVYTICEAVLDVSLTKTLSTLETSRKEIEFIAYESRRVARDHTQPLSNCDMPEKRHVK